MYPTGRLCQQNLTPGGRMAALTAHENGSPLWVNVLNFEF
ncbi:hypothetical protein NIES23_48220 [Trichormus variabilis NIES-23]|uniref:Uncharacterized protein n=1 Tax=Trichormus variabilis NIES-23 TaxID=1973479 RepID=A0A1Z4KSM4_ANAVA|nr:hypothetical protein NIES23_48220 [Trichormus variabilis NIES-23]